MKEWGENPLLEHMHMRHYEGFLEHQRQVVGNQTSTAYNLIRKWKAILKYVKRRFNLDMPNYKPDEWHATVPNNDSDLIYINHDELDMLLDAILDDRLAKVRDVYVFACGVGWRIGDIKSKAAKLREGRLLIRQGKTLKKNQQKPLWFAQEVWDKYNGDLPVISEHKYNKYLKDLFEVVGINRIISLSIELKNGRTVDHDFPLHEVVTSHSAIKSYIFFLIDAGVPLAEVAGIVGKSIRTIESFYYSINQETKDEAIDAVNAQMMERRNRKGSH